MAQPYRASLSLGKAQPFHKKKNYTHTHTHNLKHKVRQIEFRKISILKQEFFTKRCTGITATVITKAIIIKGALATPLGPFYFCRIKVFLEIWWWWHQSQFHGHGHHGDNLDSVYGEDSVSLMLTLFKRRSFVLVLFLPFNQDILILSV